MRYRVNVKILNKRPGDIVTEVDRHYPAFVDWARQGDRMAGQVICTPMEEEVGANDYSPLQGTEEVPSSPLPKRGPKGRFEARE